MLAHRYPVTEWILGERGILVDTSVPEKLDNALRDALDIRLRFPSADQYEAIASRFAWPVIAGQYSDFLLRILGGGRS